MTHRTRDRAVRVAHHWIPWLGGGLLMALPFVVPSIGLAVAWFVPIPWLLVCTRKGRNVAGAVAGGVVYVLVGCIWLLEVGVAPWVGNAAFFGLTVAPMPLLTGWTCRRLGWPLWLAAPFIWSSMGYVRAHWSPFPTTWLEPGYLLVEGENLRQLAEIAGPFGGTFLILLVAGILAEAIHLWWRRDAGERPLLQPRLLIGAGLAFSLIVTLWLWGHQRRESLDLRAGPVIALVQPGIPQSLRNRSRGTAEVLGRHTRLTLESDVRSAELVIWPESVTTLYLESEPEVRRALGRLTLSTGSPLILGAQGRARHRDGEVAPTNSAYLLGVGGAVLERWDKRQLVPLAETLLWLDRIPDLRSKLGGWFQRRLSFYPFLVAGEEPKVAKVPGAGWEVGVVICYGDVLPQMTRELRHEGADVIAVLSNEAWFGRTERRQHLDMARFRAVETRLPLVRATNDGLTSMIDPAGEIQAILQPQTAAILIDSVARTPRTALPAAVPFWMNVFFLSGAATCLLAGAVSTIRGRRDRATGSRAEA